MNKIGFAKKKKNASASVMRKCTPGQNYSINTGAARFHYESGGLAESEIQLS